MRETPLALRTPQLLLALLLCACGSADSDTLFESGQGGGAPVESDSEGSPAASGSGGNGATGSTTPDPSPPAPKPTPEVENEGDSEPAAAMKEPEPPPRVERATIDESCPSYEGAFLQLVHEPECGACHGVQADLPDWGNPLQAIRSCTEIGSFVGAGAMPPGGGLDPRLREVVRTWVSMGCPEVQTEADAECARPTEIFVERARLRGGELEVRGEVSRPTVGISVEMGDRIEPVANENGRFRQEFVGVPESLTRITVRTSDGGVLVAQVDSD